MNEFLCEYCGGPGYPLGELPDLYWCRCRHCGETFDVGKSQEAILQGTLFPENQSQILQRKPGEVFVIDGDITISVLGISKGTVRIRVESPPNTSVICGEVLDRRMPADGHGDAFATGDMDDDELRRLLNCDVSRLQQITLRNKQ